MRVELEYEQGGALQYLATWDVHRTKVLQVIISITYPGGLIEQDVRA